MSRKKLIGIVAACIIGVIVVLVISSSECRPVVTFPDPNLEVAIREALNKPSGPIYASELAELTYLPADSKGIEDLSGLQYCTNLTDLGLGDNQISDISPLANLTNLTDLYLDANQISDISPLTNLTNLANLDLGPNEISDISPLANLTNLEYLDLESNQISDISPLVQNGGLGAWDSVDVSGNPLSSDPVNIYIPQLRARGVDVDY